MKVESGDTLEVCWPNHIEKFVVLSVQDNGSSSTINLTKNYKLDVIHADYSGHKQQPENFTLKDCCGRILSSDAKVNKEMSNFF